MGDRHDIKKEPPMTEADAGVERGLHADDRGQRRVALFAYKYAAKVAQLIDTKNTTKNKKTEKT